MDFGKVPIDKIAFFVAGIVPGATAIYIYYIANPLAFDDFLAPNVLGYRTKLWIAIGLSFVIGNTITIVVYAIGGAFAGGYNALSSILAQRRASRGAAGTGDSGFSAVSTRKSSQVPDAPPWREPNWRKLAIKYLGDIAPADTLPILDNDFSARRQAIALLPETERPAKENELAAYGAKFAADDNAWSQCYAQIADQLRAEKSRDFATMLGYGIRANLQATAVYLCASMILVAAIRNWICASFACAWILILAAESYTSFVSYSNPWSTWFPQLEFLTEKTLKSASAAKGSTDEKED